MTDTQAEFRRRGGPDSQKWPERLVVVDEFPMTGLGQVAMSVLARQIAGGIR